ncbi:Dbl homology domain-containing protein, partial [Pisolithus croceorrhizus]
MSGLISFPTSESAPAPSPPVVAQYLPFRRISLPAVPGPPQRTSIISSHIPPQYQTKIKRVHRRRRTSADDARDARRDKIIAEFYDTERSYFNGLDLVYDHFLTPVLASLSTPNPLLTRQELSTLFSNFIDIWNFHRTLAAALAEHLQSKSTPFSAILLAHFPYLSLYTPFITSFPASLTLLMSLSSIDTSPNPHFTTFLRTQESHPRCAHLRLSDYLLTPVQRCPRYLLLLKDILQATDPTSTEYEALRRALGLVEKITASLNTSLMTHAQTLTLLDLQRNTHNLPSSLSPLVAPGRDLLKRGTLTCQRSSSSVAYEFILLSDYLIWLSRDQTTGGPRLLESQSKPRSENERWLYAGHVDLVDMEVVMTIVHNGVTPRLDILSPQGSFALYAPAEQEILETWLTSLRAARATRLTALARVNPDSTLSASGSNIHIRQALRAFAYECADPYESPLTFGRDQFPQTTPKNGQTQARRAHIDNFLPPVWTPDAKANKCMQCGRPFGFGAWRRKHHCRICGRVVCAACSGKTFYISRVDANSLPMKEKPKPARACTKCYDTTFPLLPCTFPE